MKNRMTHLIPIKVIELHQFLFFPITLSFLSNQKRKRLKQKKLKKNVNVYGVRQLMPVHTHTHTHL